MAKKEYKKMIRYKKRRGFTPTPKSPVCEDGGDGQKSMGHKQKGRERKGMVWGFTLVETLVAISILLFALAGAMFATTRGISTATSARDQVVAFYLAQEAIEYVKNLRDGNILEEISGNSVDWLHGLGECMGSPPNKECELDPLNENAGQRVKSCGPPGPPGCDRKLRLDESKNTYQYSTGQETTFVRSVRIDEIVPDQEAIVRVTVEWEGRSVIGEELTTKVNIFNTER